MLTLPVRRSCADVQPPVIPSLTTTQHHCGVVWCGVVWVSVRYNMYNKWETNVFFLSFHLATNYVSYFI